MKRKFAKIVVWSVIFILVLSLDILIQNKNSDETIEVLVFNRNMSFGDEIKSDDISYLSISDDMRKPYMMTQEKTIVGQYLMGVGYKNEFISSQNISKVNPLVLTKNERLITVKCSIVEANGWSSNLNQTVDLIMIQKDDIKVIENVIVQRMFNETNGDESPNFFTFVVNVDQAMMYYKNINQSNVYISIK